MVKVRCELCNRNFKNSEALILHTQVKHQASSENRESVTVKSSYIWTAFILVVIIGALLFFTSLSSGSSYDAFAQCLAQEGYVMYGAYWCSHCEDQKNLFGNSWKYIDYVECSLPNKAGQTQECIDAGITSYPTWKFPDGSLHSGVYPLGDLRDVSGCSFGEEG